jgi:cytochrome P450 / NADPH-cytochrome P450 reductase
MDLTVTGLAAADRREVAGAAASGFAELPDLFTHPEYYLPVVGADGGARGGATDALMDLTREHGPAFAKRMPNGVTIVVVSSLELVEELSDEARFAKRVTPAMVTLRGFAGDGLFTAYNDEPNWAKAHNILLPAFAMDSMRAYHRSMLVVADRLIGSWDARAAAGSRVEVVDDMTRATLDIIGLAGFGFDFECVSRAQPHPFVGALVRSLTYSQAVTQRSPGGDYAAADDAFAEDRALMARIVDEVIAERRAGGGGPGDDLLGRMFSVPDPETGELLDDANIRNQVITFLIAGHDTTAGALSFALHHLMKNPAVLQLARAEAAAVFGEDPDPRPAFEDVARLRYTRQILEETLRLWPTAPGFLREARHDTMLGGRYPVRRGQAIRVLTPMLHRQPVWGEYVEEFDPSRFAPAAVADRPANAYKPFGTGMRGCIGRQFAMHEATLLLSLIVHRYRLIDDTGYRLRLKQGLTLKPDGFGLTPVRRTEPERAADRAALPALVSPRRPEAGLNGSAAPADDATAAASSARAARGTALSVLCGSNLGRSREYAQQVAELAARLGFTASVAPLDDAVGKLPADGPAVIVAASYNGRPTDDAAEFVSWLGTARDATARGVGFAVLGVGDSNWAATFQRVPALIDGRLGELGGERLLPRGSIDVSADPDSAFEDFAGRLRTVLLRAYGDQDAPGGPGASTEPEDGYAVHEVTGGPLAALARRHGLAELAVDQVTDLADMAHPLARTKRLVRLRLPEGVEYRAQDHLAVLPANDPALVARMAAALGVAEETVLSIRPHRAGRHGALPVDRPLTVRELLSRHVELQAPPKPAVLRALAALDPCPPEREELLDLAGRPDGEVPGLVRVLERCPALRGRLDWAFVLDILPPMKVRHYSISCAPGDDPRRIDLMVSPLRAPARGAGPAENANGGADGSGGGNADGGGKGNADGFHGVASTYLCGLRPDERVLAAIRPCRDAFRIDSLGGYPTIMISAGTGLAPFRGVIQDRRALHEAGRALAPALCYFGCDHPEADYLHADELAAAQRLGVVEMRPTFMKAPEHGWVFVQDRMQAEAEELWRLLERGGRVYVCGDGATLAPGVRQALKDICRRFTGADQEGAEEWWLGLCAECRYVEDVYISR